MSKHWRSAVEDLEDFVSLYAPLFDRNLSVRIAIAQTLRDDFAGGPVDLIEFLHHFTATPASTAKGEELSSYDHTPFNHGLEKIKKLALLRDEMGRTLAASSSAEEIDFRTIAAQHQWLERLHALDTDAHEASAIGVSCHCQPLKRADGSLDIVINGIFDSAINVLLRSCNHLAASERKQVIEEIQRLNLEASSNTKSITIAADDVVTWTEAGEQVFLLRGKVLLQQGVVQLRSERAVLWVDFAIQRKTGEEGQPQAPSRYSGEVRRHQDPEDEEGNGDDENELRQRLGGKMRSDGVILQRSGEFVSDLLVDRVNNLLTR
jgi:hypothetical protein